ncbi:MAG: hypothetical protein WDO13_18065 [Verrucomicrobiota bacterium]
MIVHNQHRARRYLTIVVRWLALAAGVFAATLASGIFITDHLLQKGYTATAVLEVSPRSPAHGAAQATGAPATEFHAEFQIIESPEILKAVIDDLDLRQAWAQRVFHGREAQLTSDEALAYLTRVLRVENKRGTNLVKVTAYSDDPHEAAAIANAIADRYKMVRDLDAARLTGPGGGQVQSPVCVVTRAEAPAEPTKPNKRFYYGVSAAVAGVLSVMVASSVEVILLIVRASRTAEAEPLPPSGPMRV